MNEEENKARRSVRKAMRRLLGPRLELSEAETPANIVAPLPTTAAEDSTKAEKLAMQSGATASGG